MTNFSDWQAKKWNTHKYIVLSLNKSSLTYSITTYQTIRLLVSELGLAERLDHHVFFMEDHHVLQPLK